MLANIFANMLAQFDIPTNMLTNMLAQFGQTLKFGGDNINKKHLKMKSKFWLSFFRFKKQVESFSFILALLQQTLNTILTALISFPLWRLNKINVPSAYFKTIWNCPQNANLKITVSYIQRSVFWAAQNTLLQRWVWRLFQDQKRRKIDIIMSILNELSHGI